MRKSQNKSGSQASPTEAKQFASVPQHIVLFPDGNRRWARERGLPVLQGHEQGRKHFEEFFSWCKEKGVKVVTVYGFSTENWKRSPKEVNYLMDLFEKYLGDKDSVLRFQKEGVRVRVIGQKERLRPSLQKVVEDIEKTTCENKATVLNLAVSYGGRWDIAQAAQKAVSEGKEITPETIEERLSTAGLPDPDLVIRAGGEKRFSNFLLWQSAYAELYFCNKYWPDFAKEDFKEALDEYARRQRRFGK